MDEEAETEEDADYGDDSEFPSEEDSGQVTEVPPTEGAFGKYLREYRRRK